MFMSLILPSNLYTICYWMIAYDEKSVLKGNFVLCKEYKKTFNSNQNRSFSTYSNLQKTSDFGILIVLYYVFLSKTDEQIFNLN